VKALALVACLLFGCGGASSVQRGTTMAAVGLDEADKAATHAFAERWPGELRAADSIDDLAPFEAKWSRIRVAIRAAFETLHATQAALDAWEDLSEERKLEAARDVLGALRHVASALAHAGVDVPGDLSQAIGVIGAFLGGEES